MKLQTRCTKQRTSPSMTSKCHNVTSLFMDEMLGCTVYCGGDITVGSIAL